MNTPTLQPLQPYFMLYTKSSYQKKHINRDGISHFYCFTLDQAAMEINVVPDGSADIIIKLDDDHPEAWVCGSTKILCSTLIEKGCSYFGVRYQIGETPDFLSIKPKDIVGQSIPLEDISPIATELLASLATCDNFEQYIAAFQKVCARHKQALGAPELAQRLMPLMIQRHGSISIADLSQHSGYSLRTINNAFNNHYGLSPKTFSLILRYQQVLDQLMQSNCERLTDLATDMGFADQSHFCRQFKRYNGQNPREFQNMLKQYQFIA